MPRYLVHITMAHMSFDDECGLTCASDDDAIAYGQRVADEIGAEDLYRNVIVRVVKSNGEQIARLTAASFGVPVPSTIAGSGIERNRPQSVPVSLQPPAEKP